MTAFEEYKEKLAGLPSYLKGLSNTAKAGVEREGGYIGNRLLKHRYGQEAAGALHGCW